MTQNKEQAQKSLEERNKLITESRELYSKAKEEERNLTAEEKEQDDKRMTRVEELQKEISAYRDQKDREDRLGKFDDGFRIDPENGRAEDRKVGEGGEVAMRDKFDAWCRGGPQTLDGLPTEKRSIIQRHGLSNNTIDVKRQCGLTRPEERAAYVLNVTTAAQGGNTVPTEFLPRLERALQWFGDVRALAEVLVTSGDGPMDWPTAIDGVAGTPNAGALLAESGAVTSEDPELAFGKLTLNAYKYESHVIKVSAELLQDSAIDMLGLIWDVIGERLARAQNTALTTGTGSSQPNGCVTASALGKTAAAVAAVTADEVMDLAWSVDKAYRRLSAYMMHDNTALAIRQLVDGNSNYLLVLSNNVGELDRLFGYPLSINNDMAELATGEKTILFGDFAKYKVREVATVRLKRLDELYAANDQVGFIGFIRFDGDLLNAGSNPLKHLIQA